MHKIIIEISVEQELTAKVLQKAIMQQLESVKDLPSIKKIESRIQKN